MLILFCVLFSASTTHPYQHELDMFEPSVNQLKPQKEQVRFLTHIYEDCSSLDLGQHKERFSYTLLIWLLEIIIVACSLYP